MQRTRPGASASGVDWYRKENQMAKSMKLGGGGRFAKLKKSLSGKVDNPGAVAASIGRKKYGSSKMAKMSAAGRKRG